MLRRLLAALAVGLSASLPLAALAGTGDLAFNLNTTRLVYAAELFGRDEAEKRRIVAPPGAHLEVTLTVARGRGLFQDSGGIIHFQLLGDAQFDQRRVMLTDLLHDDNGTLNNDVEIQVRYGGNVGDNFVGFEIFGHRPQGAGDDLSLTGGVSAADPADRLIFRIPGLRNVGAEGVSVFVITRPTQSSGNDNDPHFQTLSPLVDGQNGNTITDDVLLEVRNRVTLTATPGTPATVNSDNLATFSAGELLPGIIDARNPEAAPLAGLVIGRLRIAIESLHLAAPVRGLDGGDFLDFSRDTRLRISLSGAFRPGDLAFLDLNDNGNLDIGEQVDGAGFPLTGNRAFPLLLRRTGARVTGQDDNTRRLIYLPLAGGTIAPGNLLLDAVLDYAAPAYGDERASTLQIIRFGVADTGFAYAIPNCTQPERGLVRVTNEEAGEVYLFVQGYAQNGANLGFFQVDASGVRGAGDMPLRPGETLVLASHDFERIFALNDGGFVPGSTCADQNTWQGRAQMVFSATGNITVLPLLLSAAGSVHDLGGYSGLSMEGNGEISK